MTRRGAGLLLLAALGGLPACNAVSGVGDFEFATCAVHFFDALERSPPVGGPGGGLFGDLCTQDDQALIGFKAGSSGKGASLSGLAGICGVVSLSKLDPRAVTVKRSEPILQSHGTSVDDIREETCEAGQVVVGFSGRTLTEMTGGTFVSTISLHCAPLVIDGLPSAPKVSFGPAVPLRPLGSEEADMSALATDSDCPEGQIGVESRGRATSVVDAFWLGCAKPRIDCAVPAEE